MTDLDFIEIGSKIKERRLSLKMTQDFIANKLDVNPSHISNVECGRANPSLTALVKIANILECSVDFFLSNEYDYKHSQKDTETIDNKILTKLKYCDIEKNQADINVEYLFGIGARPQLKECGLE